jgi:hypothetical protein
MRPGKERPPSRDLSFREHHLPWPLLKVFQSVFKIKREKRLADREHDGVCSRDVRNGSIPRKLQSATAPMSAGMRPGSGPCGKPNCNIDPRRTAKIDERSNAGATERESRTRRITNWRQPMRLRG